MKKKMIKNESLKLKGTHMVLILLLLFSVFLFSGCLSSEPNNPEEAVNMYYTHIDEGRYDKAVDLLFALQKGSMGSDYPQPLPTEARGKIIQDMKNTYGDKGENIKINSVITNIKKQLDETLNEEKRVITDIKRTGIEIYTVNTVITGMINGREVTLSREHPVVDMGNWRIIIG